LEWSFWRGVNFAGRGGAKRLRLSLNMPFPELNDPKNLAKNVAGIGRWGNGEVELGISSLEEVPYALGLIRQSLDRQLNEWIQEPF
jgi:predicted transport protein